MSSPRCFFALIALFLAAVVISANARVIEEPEIGESELAELIEIYNEELNEAEARNPALAIAIKLIQQYFKWAAANCIKQAAHSCSSHWNNPKALISCAGKFLQQNKGRCLIG